MNDDTLIGRLNADKELQRLISERVKLNCEVVERKEKASRAAWAELAAMSKKRVTR